MSRRTHYFSDCRHLAGTAEMGLFSTNIEDVTCKHCLIAATDPDMRQPTIREKAARRLMEERIKRPQSPIDKAAVRVLELVRSGVIQVPSKTLKAVSHY